MKQMVTHKSKERRLKTYAAIIQGTKHCHHPIDECKKIIKGNLSSVRYSKCNLCGKEFTDTRKYY